MPMDYRLSTVTNLLLGQRPHKKHLNRLVSKDMCVQFRSTNGNNGINGILSVYQFNPKAFFCKKLDDELDIPGKPPS